MSEIERYHQNIDHRAQLSYQGAWEITFCHQEQKVTKAYDCQLVQWVVLMVLLLALLSVVPLVLPWVWSTARASIFVIALHYCSLAEI